MNVSGKGNAVLAMDVARDDTELLVVTENGYGKRTPIAEYPIKGRGTKGVLTIKLTEKKGGLAGALIVREHQDLLFISQNGHGPAHRASRASRQIGPRDPGREGDEHRARTTRVSAVALVVEGAGRHGRGGRGRGRRRSPPASRATSSSTSTCRWTTTDAPRTASRART